MMTRPGEQLILTGLKIFFFCFVSHVRFFLFLYLFFVVPPLTIIKQGGVRRYHCLYARLSHFRLLSLCKQLVPQFSMDLFMFLFDGDKINFVRI